MHDTENNKSKLANEREQIEADYCLTKKKSYCFDDEIGLLDPIP